MRARALALGTLCFALACTGLPDAPTGDGSEASTDAAEVPANAAEPIVRITAVGPPKSAPTHAMLRANREVFTHEQVGRELPPGSDITVTPELPGTFMVEGVDRVRFEPSGALRPGSSYTVAVAALGSGDAVMKAEGSPWTGTLVAPELALLGASLAERDEKGRNLVVDLSFSGEVKASEVSKRAGFVVNGRNLRVLSAKVDESSGRVRVALRSDRDIDEAKLQVSLSSGVPWAGDPSVVAAAGKAEVSVTRGPEVEIEAVKVREGADGYFIEVVCTDNAVPGRRSWYDQTDWDYYYVSDRCLPEARSAAERVRVNPAVGELSVVEGPGGFRLLGDFQQGDYTVTLDAGLSTVDSGLVRTKWEEVVSVPKRSPSVRFGSKGRYLPREAWTKLAVEHLNVDAVSVEIRHVPEQNLVFWLSGSEPLNSRSSNLVASKKLAVRNLDDVAGTAFIDVAGLVSDPKPGVYEVKVTGVLPEAEPAEDEDVSDTGWHPTPTVPAPPMDASRLLLTDLQLVAKRAATAPGEPLAPRIHAWVLDTHDLTPENGTTVKAVRESGAVVAQCRTSSDGGCVLKLPAESVDPSPPFALIAEKGGDVTALAFSELEIDPADDVEGLSYLSEASWRAATWTDRGVYRPGDVAHVAGLLRGDTLLAPDAGLPVVAKLIDPRGKELRRRVLTTNAAGMVSLDLPFADFAPTGTWRLDLEIAEKVVGSASFNVEEFVPERMRVEVDVPGTGFAVHSEPPVEVEARWLFGGSAEGSEVELTCRLVPGSFAPEAYRDHSFGPILGGDSAPRPLDLGKRKSKLGEEGKASMSCPSASSSGGFAGPATLVATAAVLEGGSGRATLGSAEAPVHPESFYVGLKAGTSKARAGEALTVSGVVVDWEGRPGAHSGAVDLELVRLEERYSWVWDSSEGRSRYRRVLRPSVEQTTQVTPGADGRFSTKMTPSEDGARFMVVATSGDARSELSVQGAGSRYWWRPAEASVNATPRPETPVALPIDVPELTKLGEDVMVKVDAPFAGRMLFTVETHEVVEYVWKDVVAGEVAWSFRLSDFAPNVYVAAFLIKDPHLESEEAYLPERAFGVRSVKVEPEAYSHTVKLTVPKEIRPRGELKVGIDVGAQDGPTYVTVAAVDEGILSLTKFKSPDPRDQVFAKRALGVDSFETVGWTMLLPPAGAGGQTGGGADGGGGRVQMVKPVALWSGVVEVPASGKASVSFDVPGYQGELRVMAVTAGAKRMGSADASVTVRDPLVVQPTLPRFLATGDEADIPVFVSNVSGKSRDVKVSVEFAELGQEGAIGIGAATPPLTLLGEGAKSVTLADGDSQTVLFRVKVNRASTAVRLKVVARSDGLESYDELDMPLQSPNPEARLVQKVELGAGSTDILASVAGWEPGSDRSTVWVTANPYAEVLGHLRYVARYPYGCVEQTTSSTRPLLFLSSIVDEIDPTLTGKGSVDDMVQHGIRRLANMQTPSGGLAYWPGGRSPNVWGTAYAVHLWLDAKDAGHAVPEASLTDALNYMEQQARLSRHDGRTAAYLHYGLARAGRANVAKAQEALDASLKESPKDVESHYLLRAAVYLGGDRRHEKALRSLDTSPVVLKRENDWTFYSTLRERGFVLSTYIDLFGADDTARAAAEQVAAGLRTESSRSYTTQEVAWGLTAIGKLVKGQAVDLSGAVLTVDGKKVDGVSDSEAVWTLSRATQASSLSVALPRGAKQAWAVVTTEGIRETSDAPLGGAGLSVSRSLVNAEGGTLNSPSLGDAMFMKITIKNTSGHSVQNIALVDRLPAGLEIENPRLGRGQQPAFMNNEEAWKLDHMNLRDDRLEVFGELGSGESRVVVFGVRAVTAGSFAWPGTSAEAMYDPGVWARQASERLDVQGPWGGS